MNEKQIVDLLLSKETEIDNKFHQAIREILRLGYETPRGKKEITDLIDSIYYSLEEMERVVNR